MHLNATPGNSTNYGSAGGLPSSVFSPTQLHFSAERAKSAITQSRKEKSISLSDPTLRWIAALYDPRQCYEDVAIPLQAIYSEKNKVFARGQFFTGTTGVGFVSAAAVGSNDGLCARFTTATSVGTTATAANAFTNLSSGLTNSRYAQAAYGTTPTTCQGRLVAMSLYVRYAGTELNKGGDIVLLEEPNHQDIGAYSYNTALAQDGAKRLKVGNDWVHVNFSPNNYSELAYVANSGQFIQAGGAGILGCFVLAAAGNAQPFDYEIFLHFETSGSICRAASASFNDEIGANVVMGACTMFQQLDSTLGLDGFLAAIHAQGRNLSGVSKKPANGNWAGLLPYLPMIANLLPLAGKAVQTVSDAISGRAKPKKVQSEEKALVRGIKAK